MAAIPHVNVKDDNTRRILQPMKETIESHVKLLQQQTDTIAVLQSQLNTLTKKINASS